MSKRNVWQFLGSAIGRIIILVIVVLFIFNIGRTIYKNYQINEQIISLKSQISILEDEKLNLENRILYYQTATFKELELREHLGYKKPDEKVVVLYEQDDKEKTVENENQTLENFDKKSKDSAVDHTPNWQKWWEFIFG